MKSGRAPGAEAPGFLRVAIEAWPMPTRLLLDRHGGTVWSADDHFAGGASDVELSDAGRAQASALCKLRPSAVSIAASYCSTMQAAPWIPPTIICHGPQSLRRRNWPICAQIDHGQWEGRTPQEVKDRWPAELAAWEADPLLVPAPGGNTGLTVLSRALPAPAAKSWPITPVRSCWSSPHKATIRLMIYGSSELPHCNSTENSSARDSAALNILDFANPDQARLTLLQRHRPKITPPSRHDPGIHSPSPGTLPQLKTEN